MKIITLLVFAIIGLGCTREQLYAGKRLDVIVEWDYLYSKARNKPLYDDRSGSHVSGGSIPDISSGDPKTALIALGAIVGIYVVVSLVNEIVDIAKDGKSEFGSRVFDELKMRVVIDDKVRVADIVPGHNRLILDDELEQKLKNGNFYINIYSTGKVRIDHSFEIGKIPNPERCLLWLNGDGRVYLNGQCVN